MTVEATTSPDAERRRAWRETLRDPVVISVVVYSVLALIAAVAAYFYIFTFFADYDDEGTLLVTLQAFAKGHVLYRDVYSPYGPFYYEFFGGLLALTGKAVTTDLSRSVTVLLWTGTSVLYGVSVQRWTGRLAMGAAAMAAAFAQLYVLANEPMHPQALCVLLLALITLVAICGPTRRPSWSGAIVGALIAALVLTKLNLGVYAAAAGVLAAVLTIEPLRRRRWVCIPVVVVIALMPLVVAGRDVSLEWVRNLIAVDALSLAAIGIAGWSLGASRRDGGLSRWAIAAAVGFAATFVAIIAAIMVTGSSLSDVYQGTVIEAMRVREVNMGEFPMNPVAVDWAIAACAAATAAIWLRRLDAPAAALWSGLARAAVGLAIWLTVVKFSPFTVGPSAHNSVTLPTVLAWVAVLPPAGTEEGPFRRFLRVFLPALAVAEGLQVYPVAGSQVGIATMTFVPVGAICLADALTSLKAWSAARGGRELERFGVVAMIALTALAFDFAVTGIVRPGIDSAQLYANEPALPFPGATAMRLPEEKVQSYTAMIDALHEHHCTGFIGFPNINSMYLWSGIEPPAPDPPGVWFLAMDDQYQQQAVDELERTKRPCAIRSERRAELWLQGRPVPNRPLARYLNRFQPVETAGEFEFMLPKAGSTGG